MNNSIKEDSSRWDKAISVSNMGWWEADYNKEMYLFSDFVAQLLGLDAGKMKCLSMIFSNCSPKITGTCSIILACFIKVVMRCSNNGFLLIPLKERFGCFYGLLVGRTRIVARVCYNN